MEPAADPVIDEVLGELGYLGENSRLARTALESSGLTNPRKTRIAATKLEAVRRVLGSRFLLLCSRPACRVAALSDTRTVLTTTRAAACEVCAGSPNAGAVDRAVSTLLARGLRRVVVVGGSPSTRKELHVLVADRLELRLVSGTERRTQRDAKADLAWADLVAIWGSTELDHKVSRLYTSGTPDRVVTCPRRGIGAMAETLIQAAGAAPGRDRA